MATKSNVVPGTGLNRPALGKESYTRTALTPSTKYGKTPYQVQQEKAEASIASAYEQGKLTEQEKQQFGLDKGNVTVQDGKLFVTISKQANVNEQDIQDSRTVPITATGQRFLNQVSDPMATFRSDQQKSYGPVESSRTYNISAQQQSPIIQSATVTKQKQQFYWGTAIDQSLEFAAQKISPYIPSAKEIPLTQYISQPLSIFATREFLSTKVPVSPGQIAIGAFFSPYLATTTQLAKPFTPARQIEIRPQDYLKEQVGFPEPYFQTRAIGTIQPVGKNVYDIKTKFISESGDYTFKGVARQKLITGTENIQSIIKGQGYNIIKTTPTEAGGGPGVIKFIGEQGGYYKPFTSAYYKVGTVAGQPSANVFKSYIITSEGTTQGLSISKPLPQNYITSEFRTDPLYFKSGTEYKFGGSPDSFGLYKILPAKETSSGAGTYIISGGTTKTTTISKVVSADLSQTISKASSSFVSSSTKGFKGIGSLAGLGSLTKTITTTKLSPMQKVSSNIVQRQYQPSVAWVDYATPQRISPINVQYPTTTQKTIQIPVTDTTFIQEPPTEFYQLPTIIFTTIPPISITPMVKEFGYVQPFGFDESSLGRRKKRKIKKQRISPSLLGIASRDLFNITGTKPFKDIPIVGGIDPFKTRLVLTGQKRRKTSGRKRK